MDKLRSTREIVVWSEVVEHLGKKIDVAITEAAHAPDMRAMGVAQGRLAAYREMLTLPKAMLAESEMDEADKKNREAIQRSQEPQNWTRLQTIAR
jgi:hypothetical protein